MISGRRVLQMASGLVAILAHLLVSASAWAGSYQVTDLGALNGDSCAPYLGKYSFATALNDNRQVVGGSCAFAGFFQRVIHAYSWSGGVMTDIGTLGLGSSPDQSAALGINNAGQIVGRNYFGIAEGTAFLWSSGTMTSLETVLGEGFSSALDINNSGQIVGLRGVPPDVASWSAFLYDTASGQVTTLPGLGGTFRTAAVAINDAGDVAGYATAAPNVFHAVRWSSNVPTDLGTLGGTHSFASGINGDGDVIGHSWMPGDTGEHAFLYRSGTMHDLGTLGGGFSRAAGISETGLVVGSASDASNQARAFLHDGSAMADLNDSIPPASGWLLVEATAVNAAGEIVGTGRINNETHAFLLTPWSPPTDTTPPILTVPVDVTVEATSSEGAIVSYVVTATDDLDPNPTVACIPPPGSTFPVGTTTVECVATDNAGNSAAANFAVTVVPPLEISVELARTHSVDLRTGIVILEGVIGCNRGTTVAISGQLTEIVGPRSVRQGTFDASVACVAPVTTWSTTLAASSGRFGRGPAKASALASGCETSCDSDQTNKLVLLVGRRR